LKAAVGFRLAQSDLTLDDIKGSETKITVFDLKYVDNGRAYLELRCWTASEHDFRSHRQLTAAAWTFAKIFGLLVVIMII